MTRTTAAIAPSTRRISACLRSQSSCQKACGMILMAAAARQANNQIRRPLQQENGLKNQAFQRLRGANLVQSEGVALISQRPKYPSRQTKPMTSRLFWYSLALRLKLAQKKQMQPKEMGGETMRGFPIASHILCSDIINY